MCSVSKAAGDVEHGRGERRRDGAVIGCQEAETLSSWLRGSFFRVMKCQNVWSQNPQLTCDCTQHTVKG